MNNETTIDQPQKRILVAPLNWGLGHATRCIPIICALQKRDCEVHLASDGAAFDLLRAEFPELPLHELPSYEIGYGSENMVWNVARQFPKMVVGVRREQWATERLVQKFGFDGILSDNRYGCFSRHARSVILTHQLNLKVPVAPLEWLANRMLRRALAKFDDIWIPDVARSPNLSGELAHSIADFGTDHSGRISDLTKPNLRFIGILTRMRRAKSAIQNPKSEIEKVVVVLSGPEPQRTFLEKKLMEQALALPQQFLFILGKTAQKKHFFAADNLEVVHYLTSRELNEALLSADLVVCRSGYSSLMDLAELGKKAVLIPTPGQTEQEYLARHFHEAGVFLSQNQRNLNLKLALEQAANFSGFEPGLFSVSAFEGVLEEWLTQISRPESG